MIPDQAVILAPVEKHMNDFDKRGLMGKQFYPYPKWSHPQLGYTVSYGYVNFYFSTIWFECFTAISHFFQFHHVWFWTLQNSKFKNALFRLIFNRFPKMKHFCNLDNLWFTVMIVNEILLMKIVKIPVRYLHVWTAAGDHSDHAGI